MFRFFGSIELLADELATLPQAGRIVITRKQWHAYALLG